MKIACATHALADAVAMVSRAVPSHSSLGILEGIFLKAAGGKLTLVGNDLDIGIEASIDAQVTEDGEVVLNAKLLTGIVRSLAGEMLTIETDEKLFTLIKSGAAKFEITGISADEFPALPKVNADYSISLPSDVLKTIVEKTAFSASTSDNNPILTGCLLEIKPGGLSMIALDGYRMAIRNVEAQGEFSEHKLIIPQKSLTELSRIIPDDCENIEILATSRHAIFIMGSSRLVTRLIEGEYMNYQGVIPASYEIEFECETAKLVESVQRASLLIVSDLLKSPVKFNIGDNNINITCSTSAGNVDDNIPVSCGDASLEIGFYNKYLLDALRAIEADTVKLRFNKSVNPLVISPIDGNDFLYLILPLRLRAQ